MSIIFRNCPSEILSSCEYSFTSSAITEMCNRKHVKHHNIMHGEKIFTIRDSFYMFDKYFVWDDFYEALARKLKASVNEYYVFNPASYLGSCDCDKNVLKYYLTSENSSEVETLGKILKDIVPTGWSVVLRIHPKYSMSHELSAMTNEIVSFENPKTIGLRESLSGAGLVVGQMSSVLYLARRLGKISLIDDISSKLIFNSLNELEYWGSKYLPKLSEHVFDKN